MFTDQPTTPARIEALIDLLASTPQGSMTDLVVKQLMQPSSLPGLRDNPIQVRATLSAARELGLVTDVKGKLTLTSSPNGNRTARSLLLAAFDEKVLSATDVEPWFALFYSYRLQRGNEEPRENRGAFWDAEFNRDFLKNARVPNRFNATKYTGFRRWLCYAGLGWLDASDAFQPNPYGRIRRKLLQIFANAARLDSATFMKNLAMACPELDGGQIFCKANAGYQIEEKQCTSGLAHALIELHLDQIIQLDCPKDSHGWSLSAATPPKDTRTLRSDRLDFVDLLNSGACDAR